ncbi:restriction endonuclease subunit S [Enorma sp.]|uniref:restriction endonuclease subunit S n=1 Tax=Enorma sp. TaxID=1920692 RepID=UPI003AB83528
MSKIDELITELCPDGVEYRKLGDISRILRGKRLTKIQLQEDGKYPVFHGGLSPIGFFNENNRKADCVMVINVGASAGTVGYSDCDFWSSDGCYCLARSNCLNQKFLYVALKSQEYSIQSRVRHAGIPTLDAAVLEGIEIPVPPIEVQREIVRILDAFTDLTADLTAELSCRRQQYAYYRDRLLSRESLEVLDGKPVEMKRLDEISISIKAGGDVPDDTVKGQTEPTDTHPYPVFSNGSNDKALYGYCSKYSIEKESVTISARGSIGFHSVRKPYFTPVVRLITVTPDVETITSAYLDLALTQTSINGDKGGIPQLTIPKVKGIEIPVPSLETQRKVVDILDRFDALTTSLTDGIPAEIEARKAQNAYYRDRLLDFPRKSGDAS